jgi:hypothetical protein
MEKIKYDYDPEENYDYNSEEGNYEQEENEALKKSLRGYRVIIIVLTIVLAGTSVFCFSLYRNERKTSKKLQNEKAISEENYKMSEVLRGALTNELDDLKVGYDTLRMKNDTLNVQFENAQKMIDQLKNERRLNYNALAKYKKEIESMRGVMKSYLKQIDSLNKQVKVVSAENINLKKKITSETLRAEKAEEQAKEAKNLIKQGSVLRARDISLVALNAKDNEVSRIKNAKKLRVDFVVGANDLAAAGHRNVYLCLISPDGYTISTEATPEFDYQGSKKIYSASREIDYQNEDISVSIFYSGSGFTPGTYKAELYMDDTLIGSAEIFMK